MPTPSPQLEAQGRRFPSTQLRASAGTTPCLAVPSHSHNKSLNAWNLLMLEGFTREYLNKAWANSEGSLKPSFEVFLKLLPFANSTSSPSAIERLPKRRRTLQALAPFKPSSPWSPLRAYEVLRSLLSPLNTSNNRKHPFKMFHFILLAMFKIIFKIFRFLEMSKLFKTTQNKHINFWKCKKQKINI